MITIFLKRLQKQLFQMIFFIEHKEIFKNFLCLKNTVIIELNGNEKRKKTFIINFNSKPFNSFIYPNNLKKSLNDILQDI